tara:strand:+ start:219 stop:401 length:183 start_codon:yes stop_codon:yes gene_type:complete
MEKKYNNIEDISTSNLYRMLEMDRFQDDDSQKMIKDELKFRDIGLSFDDMISVFKGCKYE